ncbi:SgcJ/EcaC family oxidoreductase [Micromonospora sp. NPDC051227]|uniref:SgcJ/EcaC family oxidoreductase n=1 Tax=Micromonospora sp. NPDC051227 TaxID=3364285 RepID=UPI001931F0E0|nr:SgcJ/EcaC family oxidoreductase [Micromonospora sp. STR1s_5]
MTSTTSESAAPSDAEQAAVAAVPQRIVEAWAEHDADAFAAQFAEDGTMILPGLYCKGRTEIRDFIATAFAGPYRGTRVTGQPFEVRFLSPDTALLLTEGGVLAEGESDVAPERAIRASWLLNRQEGRWLLAAYQNSPAQPG